MQFILAAYEQVASIEVGGGGERDLITGSINIHHSIFIKRNEEEIGNNPRFITL